MTDEAIALDTKDGQPLSTMHLRCASALWRRQVEAAGHVWTTDIPIPASVFEEARVVIEPLLKPTVEMVNAMIAPIVSQLPAWDVNAQAIARTAAMAAAEQWTDGVRAVLGRKVDPPKAKPKLVRIPGGRA